MTEPVNRSLFQTKQHYQRYKKFEQDIERLKGMATQEGLTTGELVATIKDLQQQITQMDDYLVRRIQRHYHFKAYQDDPSIYLFKGQAYHIIPNSTIRQPLYETLSCILPLQKRLIQETMQDFYLEYYPVFFAHSTVVAEEGRSSALLDDMRKNLPYPNDYKSVMEQNASPSSMFDLKLAAYVFRLNLVCFDKENLSHTIIRGNADNDRKLNGFVLKSQDMEFQALVKMDNYVHFDVP
jgi:hypothetical protein